MLCSISHAPSCGFFLPFCISLFCSLWLKSSSPREQHNTFCHLTFQRSMPSHSDTFKFQSWCSTAPTGTVYLGFAASFSLEETSDLLTVPFDLWGLVSYMIMLDVKSRQFKTLVSGWYDFCCNKLGSSAAFVFLFQTILIHVKDIKATYSWLWRKHPPETFIVDQLCAQMFNGLHCMHSVIHEIYHRATQYKTYWIPKTLRRMPFLFVKQHIFHFWLCSSLSLHSALQLWNYSV